MPTANETKLHLVKDLHFNVRTGSGHSIEIDSPVGEGALAGPTPMELQLVALGGCTAMDVISILRKMREDVTSYDLAVRGERATEHPMVYTSAVLTHVVRGRGVVEASMQRAIELSMARYCPVFAMLYPKVDITERYEIIDEETGSVLSGAVLLEAAAESA
jgi:putative redox protein